MIAGADAVSSDNRFTVRDLDSSHAGQVARPARSR